VEGRRGVSRNRKRGADVYQALIQPFDVSFPHGLHSALDS